MIKISNLINIISYPTWLATVLHYYRCTVRRFELLAGYQHLFIVFVADPESRPSGADIAAAAVAQQISSRSRVLLHVPLHPIWKLLLPAVSEPDSLGWIRLETTVHAVTRLSWIFGLVDEPRAFGHAVDVDACLKGSWTLLIEYAWIILYLRSPKLTRLETIEGRFGVYFAL
jgi:hypothetical protein